MASDHGKIIGLFGGPGGWAEGLKALGLSELGIEWDADAVATRTAAGHLSLHADVASLDPMTFGPVWGVIASPPCPALSQAGDGRGREHLPALVAAIHACDWAARPDPDPEVWLGLEVGRWVEALRPEWVAVEQVKEALPMWRAYETVLRSWGYSTWSGILQTADFGVPQTRKRAILMASRVRTVHPPEPTHAKDPTPSLFGELLPWVSMADALGWPPTHTLRNGMNTMKHSRDPKDMVPYERSVMQPAPTITGSGLTAWKHAEPGEHVDPPMRWKHPSGEEVEVLNPGHTQSQPNRRRRRLSEPAPTIAFGHDAANWRWQEGDEEPTPTHLDRRAMYRDGVPTAREIPVEEPAPTMTGTGIAQGVFVWRDRRNDQSGSGEVDPEWPWHRPATTVAGRLLVTDPGANANRFNGKEKSRNDGWRVTIEEAAVLQGFRRDYPWHGGISKQGKQVGNAVPPR